MLRLVRTFFQKNWLVLCTVSWLLLLPAAICVQLRYDSLPGIAAVPKTAWPAASKIKYSTITNTLVMVLHPRCPCSRASVQQVASMMNTTNPPKCIFLFYTPSIFAKGWEKTDIWNQASEIPDSVLISDIDGRETKTSEHPHPDRPTFFDRQGFLRYSGGLTEGRGHQGECRNLEAAIKALNDSHKPTTFGAVYGCPVVDSRKAQL